MVIQNTVSGVVDFVNSEKSKLESKSASLNLKWRAVLAEVVSTTLLLFLGCMSCVPVTGLETHPPMYAPFGFGLIVLYNITSFGHISGAHMNPAVTLSAILYGNMSILLGIAYAFAQFAGAIAGYGLLVAVSPIDILSESICVTHPHPNHEPYQAFIIELILSMALGFINCAVWDPANSDKSDGIPLKFGFTIAALSLAGGPLTGASMNPARTLAPALWTGNWDTHWVYWAGPFAGGAISPIFYKLVWYKSSGTLDLA